MRILLTGKDGQVGFELQRALAPLGTVHAVGTSDCDLGDEARLRELIRATTPDVIVNPAAYTAVDKAESDRERAFAVNARAPTIIGEEAARRGAAVIHFSTDYVFDGEKQTPYAEQDETNPQNVYGHSKLAGETGLAQAAPRTVILRTSWVAGAHGANFAKTMLRLACEREELKVVADQIGAPTSAALLADVTAHLVRRLLSDGTEGFPFGLYHVTAGGEASWHDYARFVVEVAMRSGRPILAVPANIKPITTDDFPTPARRPRNSRLETRHFRNTFGFHLPDWHEGIGHMLRQIL